MSNGMKVLGIVITLLLLGAVFTGLYGSSWMGFGHHGSGHHGNGSHWDSDEYCHDSDEECDWEGSSHMMFYRNLDISEEDMARIEMIISNGEEQISEILSRYDFEELRGGRTVESSCH